MTRPSKTDHPYAPDYAVLPGETLLETIGSLGMDQRELAVRTGLTPKTINLIVKGRAPLTFGTAIRLERATGVPARIWNNLETNYRAVVARREERKRLESKPDWLKEMSIPVKELVARGAIVGTRDRSELLRCALGFFGVGSVGAWEKLWLAPAVSFRKSKCFTLQAGACAAWLRLGELEAQRMECTPFDRKGFTGALLSIRAMTADPPRYLGPEVQRICAASGVAVAFVKGIKGAPISGAARWLTPDKALFQLSLRHRRDDHFWFSFFHEAGHVLYGAKKAVYIDAEGEQEDEAEEAADRFAADFLIPPNRAAELRGLRSHKAIEAFAHSLGISPGIVVGQLHKRGLARYEFFQKLRAPIEWGDE